MEQTNPNTFYITWGSTANPEDFSEHVTINGTDYAYMTGFDTVGNHCLYRKEFGADYVAGYRMYRAGNGDMVRDWLQALADRLNCPVVVEWYTTESTFTPGARKYQPYA